jgi:hypothetical protein
MPHKDTTRQEDKVTAMAGLGRAKEQAKKRKAS